MAEGGTASPNTQGQQELQNRFAAVSERTIQLEMALKEKDTELMRLKQALAMRGEQSAAGPSAQAGNPLITEQELKQAYCSSVQALKDYLVQSNLASYDITGKNLPEKVTADIKTLVHTISKVCLQILKPETPYVLETISKDYASTSNTDWELDKSHWINVIAQLQLSNLQVLSILHARELHVAKMQVLLQERATMARQAAELTAAACSTGPGGMLVEEVSNMSVLIQHGYLYFARNALLLQRIVDMFKESLLREQKTVMELFLKVLYQVLSPVQAALFVVEAFPYHCDVLALSNVLALVFGKDGSNAGGMGNMANMGPTQTGMGGGESLEMMMGMGGGGMGGGGMGGGGMGQGGMGQGGMGGGGMGGGGMGGGPGSNNTLTPQDAMLLHQHFANGSSAGGAPDKLSLMQQQSGQQDMAGGGMGGNSLAGNGMGGGGMGSAGMGGNMGNGSMGSGAMGGAGMSGGPMGGGLGGGLGMGPGMGGGLGGGNPGGQQRLNPFGAMAEMQSMMGGTGSGPVGSLDVGGMRGGDGGPGGMSAAAVKQELQSLHAAAMARQAAGQMGGGGMNGELSAKGGGGLGMSNQPHNMSGNLSGISPSGGLMENGVGPSATATAHVFWNQY
ncbi:hypothetical protein GPECTOR_67g321 [Gonium pectorale]|uniref:Uncharacterized protein n=1 Tax=Gonium pectorale TaxID=33097 RepID=A0A150G3T5_GONPE|nr:hypothetical protein GPECTOR_67g321 [Gonium pectorale]|eukprot:KXZ44481.1 hypothetical protein GPECTOR_67g321 [Gonium pectorale]